MTCQGAVELMQRDLDHDLSDSERLTMLAHMSRCSECADVYSRLQQLSLDLASIPKVLPPYSLVDSILPRLEEIDRLRIQETTKEHLSAASQRTSSVEPLHRKGWFGKMRQSFPLSAIGGVVAAGIMLAIFLTNQDNLLQRSSSDEALFSQELASRTVNEDVRKKEASNDAGSGQKMNVSGNQAMDAPNTDTPVNIKEQTQTNREITSNKSGDTPVSNQLKIIAPEAPSSTSSMTAAAPSSIERTENSTVNHERGNTDTNKSIMPAAKSSPAPNNNLLLADPGPIEPPVSGKLPDEQGSIMGFSGFADQRLESPDSHSIGIFNPDTKRVTVVKTSDEKQVIFLSEHEWSHKDQITLLNWKSDTLLSYMVTQDGVSVTYNIDLLTKMETIEPFSFDTVGTKE